MPNELVPVGQGALAPRHEVTPGVWAMINDMAPVMHASRLFGATSKEAAAAIMLKGYELGLSITASFEFIQVIQGKPSLAPRGALALLLSHPLCERITIKRIPENPAGAYVGHECTMVRRGGFAHTARFTLEDANRAGLVKAGSGWANYPENMCLWRAVGFAADVVFPDITAGMTAMMKMPEQYGVAITEGGDIIEGQYSVAPAAAPVPQTQTQTPAPVAQTQDPVPPALPAPAATITLDMLLEVYTAEQILIAGSGRLPSTDDEVMALAEKLAAGGTNA